VKKSKITVTFQKPGPIICIFLSFSLSWTCGNLVVKVHIWWHRTLCDITPWSRQHSALS